MPIFWPFSDHYLSIGTVLSDRAIYGVINPFAAMLVVVLSIGIMYEFKRTPWEILSVRWDKRLVNFLMLPFRKNCSLCDRKAFFLDEENGEPLCLEHVNWKNGDVIVARNGDSSK